MKWFFVIHLLLVVAIYGCREFKPNGVKDFIPGTYIRFFTNEIANEYDTILLSVLDPKANKYQLVRRWKYEPTGGRPDYQLIITTGIYYPEDKLLEDMDTGDLLLFEVKEKALFIGSVKYKKL